MAHDWKHPTLCPCGERGCGSYRPFGPGTPTSRELREDPDITLARQEKEE